MTDIVVPMVGLAVMSRRYLSTLRPGGTEFPGIRCVALNDDKATVMSKLS